jgi:hypothetical protein
MFVFLLVLTGILLITLNIRAINKDKSSFKANLNMSLKNAEENGIEVGVLRAEIAELLLELQTEMEEIKEENNLLNERIILLEAKKSKTKEKPKAAAKENKKIDEIQKLMDMGFSVDEAAVKLGVDKGEVILIKDLYLK